MDNYNHDRDYCGPEGMHISKLIPRKIGGVDINFACYMHDSGWADGEGHTKADNQFRRNIEHAFNDAGKPRLGKIVAFVYWLAVRKGRLVLWLKGVR